MLEGIRVVELATYIAAPAAAGIMADWGAEVIKVEPLQGDAIRGMFKNVSAANVEGNPIFDMDNRGKRGLAVDLRNPQGAEALKKLVLSADVFITNVRPGGLARAGLDWATDGTGPLTRRPEATSHGGGPGAGATAARYRAPATPRTANREPPTGRESGSRRTPARAGSETTVTRCRSIAARSRT